jgi:hypothetical protein
VGLRHTSFVRSEIDAVEESHQVTTLLPVTPFPISNNNVPRSLGFGAENLLKPLQDRSLPPEDRVDVTKKVKDLSVQDWALIVRAFDNWPFAPDVRRPCRDFRVYCLLTQNFTAYQHRG